LAKKKKTGDLYAIKVLKKVRLSWKSASLVTASSVHADQSDLARKNMVNAVMAERNVLATVHNPFIVKMFYAFQSKVRTDRSCQSSP
jgi:hypothetical protein